MALHERVAELIGPSQKLLRPIWWDLVGFGGIGSDWVGFDPILILV